MHKLFVYAYTCVTLVVSDTIVHSCVPVLYRKHEILYDIHMFLNKWRLKGAWEGGTLCVAYNFFISISLIT